MSSNYSAFPDCLGNLRAGIIWLLHHHVHFEDKPYTQEAPSKCSEWPLTLLLLLTLPELTKGPRKSQGS